jgi:hypothetical protein
MEIKTTNNPVWINAHTSPPLTYGSAVLALTRGGKLIETIWTLTSIETCDAYMLYPKIPADIKALQQGRNCE